jgi:hypothetical protein
MKRSLFLVACLATLLATVMSSAGAAPGGAVPIVGGSTELSFTGTFTLTGFAAQDKQLHLEGTLNGPLATSNGGIEADLSDLPAQLPVDTIDSTCQPPQVTIATEATTVAIPGFDGITLEPLTLLRPVDPADTALVEQVCQVANDADHHGKLKGKRLTEAVDALNAFGGTWQLAPVQAAPAIQ